MQIGYYIVSHGTIALDEGELTVKHVHEEKDLKDLAAYANWGLALAWRRGFRADLARILMKVSK